MHERATERARDAQGLLDLVNGRVGLLDVVVRETFAELSVVIVVLHPSLVRTVEVVQFVGKGERVPAMTAAVERKEDSDQRGPLEGTSTRHERGLAYDLQELVKDLHIDHLVRLCPEQLVLVALLLV